MKKKIGLGLAIFLLAIPAYALADSQNTQQLVALYQQLVQLLQKELWWLQNRQLTIAPESGSAPLTVSFTLNNPSGTEAIDRKSVV